MNNIPMPVITGVTDAEKIQNIISYLSQLFTELDRVLSSIGFPNLSQELSESIRKGITEHQSLSEYATKRFTLDTANDRYNAATNYTDARLSYYAKTDYVDGKVEDLQKNFNSLSDSLSNLSGTVESINDDIFGIKASLKSLEDQVANL